MKDADLHVRDSCLPTFGDYPLVIDFALHEPEM